LVTRGKSDVAAVTIINHAHDEPNKTVFHMVKNRDCAVEEISYYETFINLLNDQKMDAFILEKNLLSLTVHQCRAKLMSRATKLQKAVKDSKSMIMPWAESNDPMQGDIDVFRTVYKNFPPNTTAWSELLSHFLVQGLHPISLLRLPTIYFYRLLVELLAIKSH
jgi:hypothetical protein